MKFWSTFQKAFLHALITLCAMIAAWGLWAGWAAFVKNQGATTVYTPWDTLHYATIITLTITPILSGSFLVVSFLFHYLNADISIRQAGLSSLTLTFSSLLLLLVLPQGGMPVIALLVGLPILSSFWMLGGRHRPDPQQTIAQ